MVAGRAWRVLCGKAMRIQLICPAPPGSLYGNRVTALRWARILRRLGPRVRLAAGYRGGARARAAPPRPGRPPPRPGRAPPVAPPLVAFQPLAARALPARLRRKLR